MPLAMPVPGAPVALQGRCAFQFAQVFRLAARSPYPRCPVVNPLVRSAFIHFWPRDAPKALSPSKALPSASCSRCRCESLDRAQSSCLQGTVESKSRSAHEGRTRSRVSIAPRNAVGARSYVASPINWAKNEYPFMGLVRSIEAHSGLIANSMRKANSPISPRMAMREARR
jgi:hypothetical protein